MGRPAHSGHVAHRPWREVLRDPASERHVAQVYRDAGFLGAAVAAWAAEPLRRGGAAILLATPEHAALARSRLHAEGLDAAALEAAGRLVIGDARTLIARLVGPEGPRADAFKATVRDLVRAARAACPPGAEVRAWGELVNVLWHEGRRAHAQRLEAIWNELVDEEGIRLLCSYRLDNLAHETHASDLGDVCTGHSRLVPEEDEGALDRAVAGALLDALGEDEAARVRVALGSARVVPTGMPASEAVLLALAQKRPEDARRVFAALRARMPA